MFTMTTAPDLMARREVFVDLIRKARAVEADLRALGLAEEARAQNLVAAALTGRLNTVDVDLMVAYGL